MPCMCTSQTTVVLSRKKKKKRHAVILQPVFGSKNCFVKPWSTRPPSCANRSYQTEALFVGQKGGKGVNSFLFTVCPYPIWSQAWYLENPGCFKHQEWEEKKCRFQHCFWRDFFVRFSTIEKLKHKEKVPVTSGMQNELWGSFQKSIFKINRCLTPTKRGNSRNSFRPMLSSAHALVTLPGIWNGGYKEKKRKKVHPTTSASKIKVINLSPIFPVSPTQFEEKTGSQLPWSLFSSLADPHL